MMTSVGCPGRKSTRSGYPTNAALIIAVSYICQGIKERSGKRIRSPATQPRRTKRAVGVSRNALITNQIGQLPDCGGKAINKSPTRGCRLTKKRLAEQRLLA